MDWNGYAKTARLAAAESAVLLRNENDALPLAAGEKVAVFGRIQFHYYRSGTGSGGMVNVPYETNVLDALKESGQCSIDQTVENIYREWLKNHPFDRTFIEKDFWYVEPWAQEEMPVSESMVAEAAGKNTSALIVIGRTAGEERDSLPERGSWYLSEVEEDLIRKVTEYFPKTIVVLNTANIIDMSWVETYQPSSVLYIWQGGMEGGNAAADILLGRVNPCGKLSDSIAASLSDYPSDSNFGDKKENVYQEDIYVGYRYFETFAPDKILYPFGFGLSYTKFEWQMMDSQMFDVNGDVSIEVCVKNVGSKEGKEVLQVYVEKPQGKLGNPRKELAGFVKTEMLQPGDYQTINFFITREQMSSYDDSGKSGHKSAWVIEKGTYTFYVGNSSQNVEKVGDITLPETKIIKQLEEVLAPIKSFKRIKPILNEHGYSCDYESVPTRTVNLQKRIRENQPVAERFLGDKGWKLEDVKSLKVTMEEFLSQILDEDLACLVRGEGMRSPKVTSGTAAAFGGVTDTLKGYGIPVGCCADGPSGIRRDDGHQAFSIPIGTALACTFNIPLVEELFIWMGKELAENKIEFLLGPGMNIHRHPLGGRNFEYFSEDPLLSGKMAAAQIRGIGRSGMSGTLKHFAANNQETARTDCNCVVSERALREIYLKGFQIALEESKPQAIMSTYGPINGIWTAGNYDLLTTVLRKEWGYDGLVMTDWWSRMNEEGNPASEKNTTVMIQAQNDLYMVVEDSLSNSKGDNTMEGINAGKINRGELVRNAANICRVLIRMGS